MDHISELRESLKGYLGWNKARMSCFVQMLLAVMLTRTINLSKLACALMSEAEQFSRYRRLQRFFTYFKMNYDQMAGFIFSLFFISGEKHYLSIDRTNWKWGKKDINILTLGMVFKGTAIPIYWTLLNKRGNSDTAERIELINRFTQQFGSESILGLLGDREFVGKTWFKWLLSHKIPFYIRIKNNTITTNSKGQLIDIDALFYALKPGEYKVIEGLRKIWGHDLYLSGLKLSDGELLIVATNQFPEDAIKVYGLRWEIETLFGCLKGRGFHFEDTHITDAEKIKKIFALLSIAFCWAHKTGEWKHEEKPIKLKKHGRLSISLFRYGLDYLVNAILKVFVMPDLFRNCLDRLKPTSQPITTGVNL